MNFIRKHMQSGSVKTVILILALVLGISGGIFALRSATELLTVRADETMKVSPTEPDEASAGQKKDVSPSDDDIANDKTVVRKNAFLLPMADPSPVEIPIYVTHNMTMRDGRVVSTAFPAGAYSNALGSIKSILNGETKLEVAFDRSLASSQPGVFYYGHDLRIYLYAMHTNRSGGFDGNVTLHLNDGTNLNWPLDSSTSYGNSMTVPYYNGTFKWSSVTDEIGNRTVESITVNQINAFYQGATLSIIRHSDVPVRADSYAPDNI